MPKIKNLAALVAAVEAGRRYARNNPDKAGKYVDQAAEFVDKQTKGKYSGQISGVAQKAKGLAGIRQTPGAGGNGYNPAYERPANFNRPPGSTTPQPGQSYPGTPER